MNNVIQFRPATKQDLPNRTQDGDEQLAVDMVADLFKAHITTLLCPEFMDDYDAQMVEYLYEKYSEKFEEYMK